MKDYGLVAVLMGGLSSEREISLVSGKHALASLQRQGIDALAVDPASPQFLTTLMNTGFNRAFNALHGRLGEDGALNGLLNLLGIPCTGSGHLASALAMDKVKTKQIWQALSLPTLPYVVIDENKADWQERLLSRLEFPMAIKPNGGGSTLGISCCQREEDLALCFIEAQKYASQVFAEPWINGGEYTVGILNEEVLPVIHIRPKRVFYDYKAKYDEADTTEFICPADLTHEETTLLKDLALQAFRALGASGWGRVDFLRDSDGKFWLVELNTVPGLTEHSLVPTAAKQMGMCFDDLIRTILETSCVEKIEESVELL